MLTAGCITPAVFLRSKLKKAVRADCFLLVRKWDVICILSAYSANNGVER